MKPLATVRLRQDLLDGTILEELDEKTVLVEFADEQGKTLELLPVPKAVLTTDDFSHPAGELSTLKTLPAHTVIT